MLDAARMLFAPGRLDAVHMLVCFGKPGAPGTFAAPQKLFALHKLVSL